MATHITSRDREPLSGLIERVTFHSPETGFCVLSVKVRGHRDPTCTVATDFRAEIGLKDAEFLGSALALKILWC